MRHKKADRRTSPGRRRAAIAVTAIIALLGAASFRLTRPSRFGQMAKPPAQTGPPAPTRVTASISLSHDYVRNVVDDAFSRAVRHADREVSSEVRRFEEERGTLARLAVPDTDRLHFSHTVATDVDVPGNSVRFVVDGEGYFDVPWSRADYGLSLRASIRASPRMSAPTGTLASNLSVDVREFRTGSRDRSALLRQGGEFAATFYANWPFEVRFPVPLPSLDSIAEAIGGNLERAARESVMHVWNGVCDAFPLSTGSTPTWLLARPADMRFRQVRVTPSATTIQVLLDVDARRVKEQPDSECPFPARVTVTDADLIDAADREGRPDDLEGTVAVDVGLDVLGDIVHVALGKSWEAYGGWVAERISIDDVRVGRYDRGGADGPDAAAMPTGSRISPVALLLEADIGARALGMRAKGTIYVSAVPVADEGTGEVYLAGVEFDTESRHPLLAAALEAGEAVRAVRAPYDGRPIGLPGDLVPYLHEARVVGLEIDETRLRLTVRGHGRVAVR